MKKCLISLCVLVTIISMASGQNARRLLGADQIAEDQHFIEKLLGLELPEVTAYISSKAGEIGSSDAYGVAAWFDSQDPTEKENIINLINDAVGTQAEGVRAELAALVVEARTILLHQTIKTLLDLQLSAVNEYISSKAGEIGGSDPQQVAVWFDGLEVAEQNDIIQSLNGAVGNQSGVSQIIVEAIRILLDQRSATY